MFRKEVKRLVKLGVLEDANDSEWGAPSFAEPKANTNWVRFLLKFKPYPMTKICEMLSNLEVIQCATYL